jgi:hypothetical protein
MQEHEEVVLGVDLPEYGLTKGDIGTIVLVHGEHEGYEVEFMTLHGETIAVVTLLPVSYTHLTLPTTPYV